jgi:hypothetical protein
MLPERGPTLQTPYAYYIVTTNSKFLGNLRSSILYRAIVLQALIDVGKLIILPIS